MARCSPLLIVDVLTSKFFSLADNKLVTLGDGDGLPTQSMGAAESTVIVGSSHGWIALFNRPSLHLFLWDPVSRRRIDLPSIETLPIPAEYLESGYGCVEKLIVSNSNPDDVDTRVVISYGPTARLAFCCPGHSGADWIAIGEWWYFNGDIEFRRARSYVDFAYSIKQNRLFCITLFQELERWNLEDPCSPWIDGSNEETEDDDSVINGDNEEIEDGESVSDGDNESDEVGEPDSSLYLVIAEKCNSDEVFVVVKNLLLGNEINRTVGFDIFKVIEKEGGKISLTSVDGSLDGLVMFIGINHSFALSAMNFSELKPDSVYFTDSIEFTPTKTRWWMSSYGRAQYDIGIFDCYNHNFYSFYFPEERQFVPEDEDLPIKLYLPLLVWFTPNSC